MGRPEFENQVQISAVTGKKVRFVSVTRSTSLASGVYDKVTVFSAPNTVSRIINAELEYNAINAAVSGGREIAVENYLSSSYGLPLFSGSLDGSYTNRFEFTRSEFCNLTDAAAPVVVFPKGQNAMDLLRGTVFDEVYGISILFKHTTGTATTAGRYVGLFIEEETINR